MDRRSAIIAVDMGLGAPDQGCAEGPRFLRQSGTFDRLAALSPDLNWTHLPPPPSSSSPAITVARTCDALAAQVVEATAEGRFPIVLGGDHSIAMGTWSGLRRSLPSKAGFDLLWIDAHMDCHVPATSPSGALHGMPLACLLGHCHPELAGIACPAPPLRPDRVTQIGIRSFEPEEAALARRLGLRVVTMTELAERGLGTVLRPPESAFGITLDLDAVDPEDAPGVGTPEPGGIRAADLLAALAPLLASPRCLALEITEFNPSHDIAGRTAALVEAILTLAIQPGERP